MTRSFRLLLLAVCAVALVGAAPLPVARLSCRPEAGPGRVLCELEVEAPASQRLTWADALVVEAPAFAAPLRARVGSSQATARTDSRIRLPVALGATHAGEGLLRVKARYVTCPSAPGPCSSGTRTVEAAVRVGASSEP